MKEFRIFGPPGTGKTTKLATEEIPKAVSKYGSDKVLIASFTRAAAKEIASKPSKLTGESIPVVPENVGTLHALCYRLLGNPTLAETNKDKWNRWHPAFPMSVKGGGVDNGIDETGSDLEGDILLADLNVIRAKILPKERWSNHMRIFESRWSEFKKLEGFVDFTDLIELTTNGFYDPPNKPKIIFLDEAQDFTPLQFKLIRQWGEKMEWVVFCGDDDQNLYHFAGAIPDAFLNPPIDAKFKRILEQSYRVPKDILQRANKIIKKVRLREPKEYQPRPADGIVNWKEETFKYPENYITDINDRAKDGKSVMILASCSYMIDPIKKALKEKGVPFHNSYRKRRGDWNPLASGNGKRTMPKDLLLYFLDIGIDKPYWNIHQFINWTKYIKVGENGLIFKQGKLGIKALKIALEENRDGLHTSRKVLTQILSPAAIKPALDRNISWFTENIQPKRYETLKYPVTVYKEYGQKGLTKIPKIRIGTIHSVKGGEADCVFLHPDISYQAHKKLWKMQEGEDALYRMFYVGMTRAKEELILMKPAIGDKRGRQGLYIEL